ncbi:hypothetical protein LCGC14_1890890 [marine sediment metagenome]|uniref:Uncharacterized protein n=1 Tax=marine sediment metagenome TaxID=412755 RepID=A0A0F9IDF8_9ZZZZ
MPQFVKDFQIESGNLIVQFDSGPPKRIPVLNFLPALNYEQVDAIKTLTNLVVVLVRTLIEKGIVTDELFMEDEAIVDLDHLIYVFEKIGGSYHTPDLSVDNL